MKKYKIPEVSLVIFTWRSGWTWGSIFTVLPISPILTILACCSSRSWRSTRSRWTNHTIFSVLTRSTSLPWRSLWAICSILTVRPTYSVHARLSIFA